MKSSLPESLKFKKLSDDPWSWAIETEEDWSNLFLNDELARDTSNPDWLASYGGKRSLVAQYDAVRNVRQLKARIESNAEGSGFNVLYCLRQCGTNDLVMPVWLSYAFNRRYDAVVQFRSMSWDDPNSFGTPYPRGTNQNSRRKRRIVQNQVWLEVKKKVWLGCNVDKQLFDEVGHDLNMCASLAEDYYYSAINDLGLFNPVEERNKRLARDGQSRKNLKDSGITKAVKKGAMKSLPTSEHEHAPKPKQAASNQSERLLRLPEVEALVGLRKSSIYAFLKAKNFPAPVVLSARAVAWPESQIQAWIAERIKASQKA